MHQRLVVAQDALVVGVGDLGVSVDPVMAGVDVREQEHEPGVVAGAEQAAQLGAADAGDVVAHEGVGGERHDARLLVGAVRRPAPERRAAAEQVRGA